MEAPFPAPGPPLGDTQWDKVVQGLVIDSDEHGLEREMQVIKNNGEINGWGLSYEEETCHMPVTGK